MKTQPERKNTRLRNYDYTNDGYYFITICSKDRLHFFGEVVNGKMHINKYGDIVENEMLNIPMHYKDINVCKSIVMPNHVHMIIVHKSNAGAPLAAPADVNKIKTTGRASAPPTSPEFALNTTIGNVVRGYKSGVSRKIGFSVWQRNYHDHIIRNEKDYLRIWQYINNNPTTWKDDRYYINGIGGGVS